MVTAWIRIAIISVAIVIISALVLLIGIRPLLISYRPNDWMAPDINEGDIVFGFRTSHPHPNFGDAVIYVAPIWQTNMLVGRIAGIPGDSIVIDDGHFFRNESEVPFFHGAPPEYQMQVAGAGVMIGHYYLTDGYWPPASGWSAPDRIPEDCYLVLANAPAAEDSHLFGFVPGSPDGPCGSKRFPAARIVTRIINTWPIGRPTDRPTPPR